MKTILGIAIVIGTLLSGLPVAGAENNVEISLVHGSPAESRVEQRLRALMSEHDLSSWAFTQHVVIDQTEIPHSHPVLTIHARHGHDDELLLSTYLHE